MTAHVPVSRRIFRGVRRGGLKFFVKNSAYVGYSLTMKRIKEKGTEND